MPCWYFDKSDLKSTPSLRDGIDADTEARYRREGARFLMECGISMGLRHETMATGVVFYHRFYMFHSFNEFPRYMTATCCLFLAGKVEETPKKCKDLVKAAKTWLESKNLKYYADQFNDESIKEIMVHERILLQTIKFDLQVDHPYGYLLKYAKTLKGNQEQIRSMVQMAWTFINDSFCTTLCLQWEPEIIAIALMYLTSKLSKLEVTDWNSKSENKSLNWWDQFVDGLRIDILEDICHQILDLYATQSNQAKSGVTSGGNTPTNTASNNPTTTPNKNTSTNTTPNKKQKIQTTQSTAPSQNQLLQPPLPPLASIPNEINVTSPTSSKLMRRFNDSSSTHPYQAYPPTGMPPVYSQPPTNQNQQLPNTNGYYQGQPPPPPPPPQPQPPASGMYPPPIGLDQFPNSSFSIGSSFNPSAYQNQQHFQQPNQQQPNHYPNGNGMGYFQQQGYQPNIPPPPPPIPAPQMSYNYPSQQQSTNHYQARTQPHYNQSGEQYPLTNPNSYVNNNPRPPGQPPLVSYNNGIHSKADGNNNNSSQSKKSGQHHQQPYHQSSRNLTLVNITDRPPTKY